MERRRHRRVPADVLVELHDVGGGPARGRARVRNFGLGGMALEGHLDLKAGETLFLKVNVPLEFLGKVVYARDRAWGVRFTRIGFFDKLRLRRYVTARFKA